MNMWDCVMMQLEVFLSNKDRFMSGWWLASNIGCFMFYWFLSVLVNDQVTCYWWALVKKKIGPMLPMPEQFARGTSHAEIK